MKLNDVYTKPLKDVVEELNLTDMKVHTDDDGEVRSIELKRATREYDIRAAMKAIRAIAGAYGLTIENRITFKDKETEEIFR